MKNPIHLRVVQPDGTVIVRTIPKLPVRLGRGAENEIVLKDRNVSRVHVELRLSGDQVFVHDCESLNGTRLNGELIVDAALHVGDVLMIGDCQVKMLDEPTWSTEKDGTDSIRVRPDGTGGVLEVIRAIDLERILRKDPQNEFTSPFSQLADGEDLRDRVNKLNQAWANLLVIMNVVSSMGNFSHPQQVCEQFVAALKGVFPMVENVAVIQFDPEASALGVVYQMGFTAPFITFTHPSKTVLRRVVDEMRAVYAVDARKDPRFSGADSLQSRGVRSMMCAPLIVRGEVRGALYVENLTTPYCFSQFDLNFLTVFAFHLGAALETSRALAERDKAFDRAVESIKAVKQDKTALLLQYSQSERKFRALFEQSALGSAVINLLTGRIEEVNDGLVRMLGFSRTRSDLRTP